MKSQRAKIKKRERENGVRGGVAVRCRVGVIYGFGHVNPGKVICKTHSYCVIFKARHKELLSSAWGSLCNVAVCVVLGGWIGSTRLPFFKQAYGNILVSPASLLSPPTLPTKSQDKKPKAHFKPCLLKSQVPLCIRYLSILLLLMTYPGKVM